MQIRVHDIGANRTTGIDQSPVWMSHGQLENFRIQWSPDSRWLAYARPTSGANDAVFLYDTKGAKLHQATTGYLNDAQPTFDPEGKFLFYASDREFDPVYGSFDNSWTYPNPTKLVAVPLRKDVKSPLAARNDAENAPRRRQAGRQAGEACRAGEAGRRESRWQEAGEPKPEEKKAEARPPAPANVDIDLDGFEARAVVLPPKAGNYADLQAIKGKTALPAAAAHRLGRRQERDRVLRFRRARREGRAGRRDGFEVTFDGKKMLVGSKGKFAILDIKAAQKFEKPMVTADMESPVDPARRVAPDVRRCVPVPARLLLRSRPARRRLDRAARSATASCSTMRSRAGTWTSCSASSSAS